MNSSHRYYRLSVVRVTAATCLSLIAATAAAIDYDRIRLTAGETITYDDNLTRVNSGLPTLSDRIETESVGAALQLPISQQMYDLSAQVSRNHYLRNSVLDNNGFALHAGAQANLAGDKHLSLNLDSTRRAVPLEVFQAEVRDLVTTNSIDLGADQALDVRWRMEEDLRRVRATHDNSTQQYNDLTTDTFRLSEVYSPLQDDQVGVREVLVRADYPNALPATAGVPVGTASYRETRLEGFADWALSAISTVHGSVAYSQRDYQSLVGANFHGVIGSLGWEYTPSGPWTAGAGIHKILGGQDVLASRVVATDSVDVHGTYTFDALISAHLSTTMARRRYSVDEPGFPAHQELENQVNAGLQYVARSWLTLNGDLFAIRRRANPSLFAYEDRRITFSANVGI